MPQAAEGYVRRSETIAGYSIAFTSYKIGAIYYAKAEIDMPGAGGRIAHASGATREEAEAQLRERVRRALTK